MLCEYYLGEKECGKCICKDCDRVGDCEAWFDYTCGGECNEGHPNELLYCNKGKAPDVPDLFLLNKKEKMLVEHDKKLRDYLLGYGGVLFVCRDCGKWTGSNEGFWFCGTTGVCDECLEKRFRKNFKDCRCGRCKNLVFVSGGLSCSGYGSFNKWAKKCRDEKIIGRFKVL